MIDPERTTAVVNPAAAGGRVGARLADLTATLHRHLGPVRVLTTAGPGGAVARARQAVEEGARTVLSLGGDGTHNEVVNGMMAAATALDLPPGALTLGVLPAGTGGDFRRLLVANATPEAAAEALAGAAAEPIDLGWVRFTDASGQPAERYFLNVASFGIGGMVDRLVNDSSKRLGGKATFLIAILKSFFHYRPATVHLVADGEALGPYEISNVFVCNGQYAGGSLHFAPTARLSDGKLDLVITEARPLLPSLQVLRRIYAGAHYGMPGVHHRRVERVEATRSGPHPAWMDIDGEAPGEIPATFEVRPGALRLLGARPDALRG